MARHQLVSKKQQLHRVLTAVLYFSPWKRAPNQHPKQNNVPRALLHTRAPARSVQISVTRLQPALLPTDTQISPSLLHRLGYSSSFSASPRAQPSSEGGRPATPTWDRMGGGGRSSASWDSQVNTKRCYSHLEACRQPGGSTWQWQSSLAAGRSFTKQLLNHTVDLCSQETDVVTTYKLSQRRWRQELSGEAVLVKKKKES